MSPDNPYAPTPNAAGPDPRLETLGIAYMILGGTDLLWGLLMTVVSALQMAGVVGEVHNPNDTSPYGNGVIVGQVIAVVISLLALPVAGLTIFAGLKMRRAEMYNLALAAALLNMLPCYQTTCCALFGLPVGAWALYTLFNAEVKASFR